VHLALAGSNRRTVKVAMETLSQDDRDFIASRVQKELQEKLTDPENYHVLTDGESILSFPRIDSSSITYTLKPSWAFLTVKTRNRGEFEILHQGSGSVQRSSDPVDLAALARKEASMHSPNHDTTEIFDLPDGGKFLVYTSLERGGEDIAERRCIIWQVIDGSMVKLDFTNGTASRANRKGRSLSFMMETIQGLRLNTSVIPHMDAFQEMLLGADTASLDREFEPSAKEAGAIELVFGDDRVSVPRVSGERIDQTSSETHQSLHALVESKKPGESGRSSIFFQVRLVEDGDIAGMLDKITESKTTGYDIYYIQELQDGSKIICLNKEGKRRSESYGRKAILFRKLRSSVLQVQLSETVWSENPHRAADIRMVSSLLSQVEVNGQELDGRTDLIGACFPDESKADTLQDTLEILKLR